MNRVQEQPLVSILLPSYNKEAFIVDSLECVRNQTYANIQLIITDDASTDCSSDLIKEWIRTYDVQCDFLAFDINRGICVRLNDALSIARGKYIAIMPADDLWLPEKLEKQVDQMEALPNDVGVLYSDSWVIDEDGKAHEKTFLQREEVRLTSPPQGNVLMDLIERNFIPALTVLIRRKCFEKVGVYDERLCYEDWDMFSRIAMHYKFAFSDFISAKYRITTSSLIKRLSEREQDRLLISDLLIYEKFLSSPILSEPQKQKAADLYSFRASRFEILGRARSLVYLLKLYKYRFHIADIRRGIRCLLPKCFLRGVTEFRKKYVQK